VYDKPSYECNDGCYDFVNANVFLHIVFTLCKACIMLYWTFACI
jgi:hypothetical protein